MNLAIEFRIENNAKLIEIVTDGITDGGLVFANSSGKHKAIQPVELQMK